MNADINSNNTANVTATSPPNSGVFMDINGFTAVATVSIRVMQERGSGSKIYSIS